MAQPLNEIQLILIRHAHVDTGTHAQRMCGWLDLPLSPSGELQLKRFRDEHSEFKPLAVYASSSSRAHSTAQALADNWRVEVTTDPDLLEINCGAVEGMLVEEVKHRFPELWSRNARQEDCDFAWPDGETYRRFRERVLGAFNRIASRHVDTRIPVVTHAGVISQVVGAIEGLSPAVWDQHRGKNRMLPRESTEGFIDYLCCYCGFKCGSWRGYRRDLQDNNTSRVVAGLAGPGVRALCLWVTG